MDSSDRTVQQVLAIVLEIHDMNYIHRVRLREGNCVIPVGSGMVYVGT